MRSIVPTAAALTLAACTADPSAPTIESREEASTMAISRSSTRAASRGPAEYFTGTATITSLFEPNGSSSVGGALVAFEPGARTAWHTHPRGQRLVVTAGTGWTQVEGGPVEQIREGDVVWCPPNVRHWHGASPTTAMSHLAVQEAVDDSPVTWMEQVSEDQYRAGDR